MGGSCTEASDKEYPGAHSLFDAMEVDMTKEYREE